MLWIAPSARDTDNAALEQHLWDAAEQARPAPYFGLKSQEYSDGRPQGPVLDPGFRQIQNLRRTRDLLLPRLLSGQVELKPAELTK